MHIIVRSELSTLLFWNGSIFRLPTCRLPSDKTDNEACLDGPPSPRGRQGRVSSA